MHYIYYESNTFSKGFYTFYWEVFGIHKDFVVSKLWRESSYTICELVDAELRIKHWI